MTAFSRCLGAAALALLASVGSAETIFRCGPSYSRVPCANGAVVDVEAPTSAARRAEASAVVAREKRLALEMSRDRRAQEAAIKPALATSLGPARPPAPLAPPAKKKATKKKPPHVVSDDGRDFIAAVPKTKKPRD